MSGKARHAARAVHRPPGPVLGRTTLFAVLLASSAVVHAQTCSGGANGGMDATGNQCNTPQTYFDREAASNNVGDAEALCEDALREYHQGHYAQAVRKFRTA